MSCSCEIRAARRPFAVRDDPHAARQRPADGAELYSADGAEWGCSATMAAHSACADDAAQGCGKRGCEQRRKGRRAARIPQEPKPKWAIQGSATASSLSVALLSSPHSIHTRHPVLANNTM